MQQRGTCLHGEPRSPPEADGAEPTRRNSHGAASHIRVGAVLHAFSYCAVRTSNVHFQDSVTVMSVERSLYFELCDAHSDPALWSTEDTELIDG